jgi:hypothetical protein
VFEKIGSAAERLASNVGASRRGFLARVGQAAAGVAGAFAGLLALPSEARAIVSVTHACVIGGYGTLTGMCIDKSSGVCKTCWGCPAGIRPGGLNRLYICGYRVATAYACGCR